MRSRLSGGLLLTAVLSVGVIAVGCGGGSDLTKAEFQKQGNAICKKGNQEITAASKEAFPKGQPHNKAEFDKFVSDSVVPAIQKEIDGIRDLNPPSADEDQVNAITDEAQSALDKVKQDPALVRGNDDPFKKANQDAKAYGLTVCGSSS